MRVLALVLFGPGLMDPSATRSHKPFPSSLMCVPILPTYSDCGAESTVSTQIRLWRSILVSDHFVLFPFAIWKLRRYPWAKWYLLSPLFLFAGSSTVLQFLCSSDFRVPFLQKPRKDLILLRYCSRLSKYSMSKHILYSFIVLSLTLCICIHNT